MCELTTALAIGSSVMGFAGDAQKTQEENAARAANRKSALADYSRQQEEAQRNYRAESRATQQKGFDEELKKRDALSRARAEAATRGAAGVSVDAVLNEIVGIGARTQSRLGDEQKINSINYQNTVESARSTAQSRMSGSQSVAGPSLVGLAINVGSTLDEGGYLDK